MTDFGAFVRLGVHHIVDLSALDHVLFLVALAAIYRPRDWRDAFRVVSAFTVGHSVTLALAVAGVVPFDARAVEFLIPLTIVATAVENVAVRERATPPIRWRSRSVLAGIFGLVHGAGFAGYLQSLLLSSVAVPLLGFNVGIELGQVVVLAAVSVTLALLDAALRRARVVAMDGAWPVLRLRAVGLSVIVGVVAAAWAVERRPW